MIEAELVEMKRLCEQLDKLVQNVECNMNDNYYYTAEDRLNMIIGEAHSLGVFAQSAVEKVRKELLN